MRTPTTTTTTPASTRYLRWRGTALAVAGLLGLAGCGADAGGADDAMAGDGSVQVTTPEEDDGAGATSPDRSLAGDSVDGEVPDALAYDAGQVHLPTTTPQTTSVTSSDSTSTTSGPTTTSGSGGAPVTTVGGGGGGNPAIYQGILGTLARDQVVTAAIAPAPTATAGILPLTGLPGDVPNRPAAVVKIDNGGPARPQSGLNAADIVVEEEVEGGITRFAAVFHSTSAIVGPVRSGRTTDIGIINGFGAPLLLYSGANDVTDALLRAQPTVLNRNAGTSSGYWRNTSRRAPSNLYTDTGPHWASASGGPPPPQFAYRADPDEAPVGGTVDDSVTIAYRGSSAGWTWDGSAWLRSQGGKAHLTDGSARVSAANVVVVETQEVATGMVDSSGATVPEFVFVGSGPATVFTAGVRIEGTWTRPTLASAATLTRPDGSVIELTPGRTWIEVIRAGAGMVR